MKNIVKKLLVVAALSCASSGALSAAAPAPQFPVLSPFITEYYKGLAIDEKTIFSHDCRGFLNLVLQLHYHWLKVAVKCTPQFVQHYEQASDAKKVALLKLWQAQSDTQFKKFLKTPQAKAFLKSFLPRYGWQNDLDKIGILRLRRPGILMDMVAWGAVSRETNLMINSEKMGFYNPEVWMADLANQPAPAPQPAPVADPAELAALEASGELSDRRCGVVAQSFGDGFVGDVYIPDHDDVGATAQAVKDSFEFEILQPGYRLASDVANLCLNDDDDEKSAN